MYRYKVVTYMRVESDNAELMSIDQATTEMQQCKLMQPENIYKLEAVSLCDICKREVDELYETDFEVDGSSMLVSHCGDCWDDFDEWLDPSDEDFLRGDDHD